MLEKVISIAKEAGNILLEMRKSNLVVESKENGTLVTNADYAVDAFIRRRLSSEFPDDLILSEENSSSPQDFSGRVWMVDPLDGTRQYIDGNNGFCVLIGLCEKGSPTLGVVYAPSRDELFYATKKSGAFLNSKQLRVDESNRGIASRNMYEFLGAEVVDDSAGLRIMEVARGNADYFADFCGKTSKWDTCAAQIILEKAGGRLTDVDGALLDYSKVSSDWKNYIASNAFCHEEILNKIKKHQQLLS